jgi:hypothetical protein
VGCIGAPVFRSGLEVWTKKMIKLSDIRRKAWVAWPLRNQSGFYVAFGVKDGDRMYLAPEQRVIW